MRQRIISSLVMLPVVLAAIWFSYPFFDILLAVAIGVLVWEWDMMVSNRITFFSIINAVLAVSGMMMLASPLSVAVFSFVVVAVCLKTYFYSKHNNEPHPVIKALGPLYITLFAVSAALFERTVGAIGLYWLLFIAFANDTGGMLVGCTLKGPKLCPSVSPAKTWSGFFGGIILAVAVSVCYVYFTGVVLVPLTVVVFITIALAVVATLGDLLESKIKRIVGVKDSSSIIPGHGGLFDRLDSVMLLMIVSVVILIFCEGVLK